MATKAEIRDRAANDLGILRLGQSLQSQDATRITEGYEEVYSFLVKEGLATWAATGDVPDSVTPYVVSLTAKNCLNTYGVSESRYARIVNDAAVAMREIRAVVSPDYVSQDEPQDF